MDDTRDAQGMKDEMAAILIAGGEAPSFLPWKSEDLVGMRVVAADSGWDTALRLGIPVNLLVGDMDSVTDRDIPSSVDVRRFPVAKDDSDTALALKVITHEWRADVWHLVGGGGGRLDHLADIFTLFRTYGPPVSWHTAHEKLVLVTSEAAIDVSSPGARVSLIPAWGDARSHVTTRGLAWDVQDYPVNAGNISLSNISHGTVFHVSVTGDPVFVITDITDIRNQARDIH
ncbi:thiamine diphosphokinase [Parasphaerochaeta coccoides]|uniref:Thiamine diphosphokinase n=1 Tax=Parasphaerochaeta coccoides (strain ATCC BAA-1237 / DSM 17374 / SPN1) TaxID=760011 RepID=F4GK04_PARC1|nr:thiamine diphosphokinase [Parasphaerochaeta coccoides]AEC01776.1 thiamine pyrophosphokinase [Parasphaerochaeta coccoides DSM 17374]